MSNEPPTVSFWDPQLKPLRKVFFKGAGLGSLLIVLASYCFIPIYWGALWSTPSYTNNLNAYVVDMDHGVIGEAVVAAFHAANGQFRQLGYSFPDATDFPNGVYGPHETVEDAVLHHRAWVAVVVTPGASDILSSSVQQGNSSYDPYQSIIVVTDQARNENAYGTYIYPAVTQVMKGLTANFTRQHAMQLASSSNLATLLTNAPQVVSQPIDYTLDNLRPFDVPVAAAVEFVGLIYLLIFSFTFVMMSYGVRMPLMRFLSWRQMLALRLTTNFIAFFIISLNFGLVSVAFQVPFSREFGKGGFVLYWILLYCGMLALGLAMEFAVSLLTPKFVSFFLIIWILANVSVALQPIEILPYIFRYGYAAPFYNISQAVRTIIFKERDMVGLNFGVLLAWIGVSLCTVTFITWYEKRSATKQAFASAPAPAGSEEQKPPQPHPTTDDDRSGTVEYDSTLHHHQLTPAASTIGKNSTA